MKYEQKELLGKGTFGNVYLVEDEAKNQFAKKTIYYNNEHMIENIVNEIVSLKKINSKHIVKIYDYYIEGNTVNIIMEYSKYGDLYSFIQKMKSKGKKIDLRIINRLIYQINCAIKELHSNNIIHRDIKPSNILIFDNFDFKLTDFGVSKLIKDSNKKLYDTEGTQNYMPPEMLTNKGYSFSCDYWSYGCTIYETLTLDRLFKNHNLFNLISDINNLVPIFDNIEEKYRILLMNLLTKEPKFRFKYDDIFSYYRDNFYNPNDIKIISTLFARFFNSSSFELLSPRSFHNSPKFEPLSPVEIVELKKELKDNIKKNYDDTVILQLPKLKMPDLNI